MKSLLVYQVATTIFRNNRRSTGTGGAAKKTDRKPKKGGEILPDRDGHTSWSRKQPFGEVIPTTSDNCKAGTTRKRDTVWTFSGGEPDSEVRYPKKRNSVTRTEKKPTR